MRISWISSGFISLLLATAGSATAISAPDPAKVLRYTFPVAETGFDPAQVVDL